MKPGISAGKKAWKIISEPKVGKPKAPAKAKQGTSRTVEVQVLDVRESTE